MRVATDIYGLERVAPAYVTIVSCAAAAIPSRWNRNLRLLLAAIRCDYLVIHFSLPEVMFFSLMLMLTPFQRCRLVTLDFFAGRLNWAIELLARHCLRRVYMFLPYFRDSTPFESRFGLSPGQFHYVPFKVNSLNLVCATPISDEGYLFCAGRSRRDFHTLFTAVEQLGYPLKILTSEEAELRMHGSSLDGLPVPDNVEILRNDSDSAFFVRCMAAARLVVIPLLKDSGMQAGIAVCLMAMALRKCVIISSGLGVSDVLLDGQAMIVTAGDAAALGDAISSAWKDEQLRQRYAETGYRYAIALGGEDRLYKSILEAL